MSEPTPPARPRVAVLLLQLGTPEAPTAAAVRPYLRQFLSDPRVIEVNRALWWLILNLAILPTRPRASAAKYRNVWSAEYGSPLLHYTRRQSELLGKALGPEIDVDFAMRYGRPAVREVVDRLLARGAERIVALPMYPQYAASSTGSACDDLFAALLARRYVPAVRVVAPYFDDDDYIGAVATRTREQLAAMPAPPDHILISFHGLPVKMIELGDPYRRHCEATAALLARRLELAPGSWTQTFQSRFGREAWLEPYTEATLALLAARGVRRVLVIAPGFTADCLETLDELGREALEAFRHAGGEALTLVVCLNDHPAWIAAMAAIVRREAAGWIG